jgi:hypothetical protein
MLGTPSVTYYPGQHRPGCLAEVVHRGLSGAAVIYRLLGRGASFDNLKTLFPDTLDSRPVFGGEALNLYFFIFLVNSAQSFRLRGGLPVRGTGSYTDFGRGLKLKFPHRCADCTRRGGGEGLDREPG